MERAIKVALFIALVMLGAFLACGAWCEYTLQGNLALLHWKISTLDTAQLNGTVQELRGKIAAVDVAKLNQAIANVSNATAHTDQAIVLVKQQLDQLDPRTLNTILLHIDRTVGHVDQASHDEVTQQRDVSARSLAVLTATENTVKGFAPLLAQLLADLEKLGAMLDQGTATASNVNHTTEQIDHKVTQMLKPAAFVRRMTEQAAAAGAKFLNWWRGFH
jgi:hypothetical protein